MHLLHLFRYHNKHIEMQNIRIIKYINFVSVFGDEFGLFIFKFYLSLVPNHLLNICSEIIIITTNYEIRKYLIKKIIFIIESICFNNNNTFGS